MLEQSFKRIFGETSRVSVNAGRSFLGNHCLVVVYHPEGGSTAMFFAHDEAADAWCDRVQFPLGTLVCLSDRMAAQRPDVGASVGKIDWVNQWCGYCVKFPRTMLILDWGDLREADDLSRPKVYAGLIDNKTFVEELAQTVPAPVFDGAGGSPPSPFLIPAPGINRARS